MYKERYLYSELASAIDWLHSATQANNNVGMDGATQKLQLLYDLLPHGSGIDSGTKLIESDSHAEKLVLECDYHHMNDGGYYDGWTHHIVTLTPSFQHGFNIRISGRNRNEIKEYLYDTFDQIMRQDVTYWLLLDKYPQFKITSKWENEDGTPSQCYQAWYVNSIDEHGTFANRFWNNFSDALYFAAHAMYEQQQKELNARVDRATKA